MCVLAASGFLLNTTALPPRYGIVLIPPILFLIYGVLPKQRAWAIANYDAGFGTLLHTVRVPVELSLYYLFLYKQVPELMTFEGRNFDILAGLTAPIIYLLHIKNKLSRTSLIIWNVVSLLLVTFILINGALSAELPFQQFAFDQPNVAMKYAPYVLLPGLIVPMVMYTHLIAIFKFGKTNFAARC